MKKPESKIRPYKPTDFDACCETFKTNIPKFFKEFELEIFKDYLRRLAHENYWVLEDKTGIVGCGGIAVRTTGQGDLCFGLVRQDRHKQGLGDVLTKYRLKKLLESPKVKFLSLNTSQHTTGFYERFGFKLLSTTENGYAPGLHRCDMRLDLSGDKAVREQLIKKLI